MDIGIVSARYAKALLKFADINKQTEQVYQAMTTLRESYVKVPQLKATLSDPVLANDKKLRLLHVAAGQSQSSCMKQFFRLVISKHRVEMMPFMAQSYIDAYRVQKNLLMCQLTVPAQLSDSTIARIRAIVEGKTKKEVEFAIIINPAIIGGFILEYDAYRLDASIAGRLRTLRKQMV